MANAAGLDPLRFVRDEVVLPDGRWVGETLDADPWIERDVLAPVFARDEQGLPAHRLCYLELARGHAKTSYGAAIACAEATLFPSTDVVICAADRDQAAIALDALDGFLARNPKLRKSFTRRRDEFSVAARGSRIRVMSSDVASSWGLGGTHRRFRVICDELTAWPERGEQLWVALASATGKVRDTQTLILSNAGFGADVAWQWKIRETAEREDWAYLFSPDGVIASWIGSDWLEQMRALLPASSYERVIENRWTAQEGDFVTYEQFRRCVDPGLRPQTSGVREVAYVAGLDLGLTKDRTAFAICHVDPVDGQTITLDELQVWQGTRTNPVDIDVIERAVVDARRRYDRLRVWADPWQLKGSIARLNREGVHVNEFVFSAGSIAKLSSQLYEVISDATLRVFDDPQLEREILGLVVVQTAAGWRVDHRAGGYSDRAIALAMAVQEAVKLRRAKAKLPDVEVLHEFDPGAITGDIPNLVF